MRSERSRPTALHTPRAHVYLSEASSYEGAEEVQEHEQIWTCRRVPRTPFRQTDCDFPIVVGSGVRDVASERFGLSRRATTAAGPAEPTAPAPPYTQSTPEQLQQLVAPIALYPDSLVAQILAASTFPEQVVEADRWVQEHPDLKGDALGQAVDQQPWDPSVKALTAFPSVLGNMDKNLSWTSSLGDAYYNQQQDVMDAVQVMRQRAERAGDLKTTPQQVVTDARLRRSSFSQRIPRSFTSPRMIRGWLTEIPSTRGRDGTRIPEFGMAARTCRLGWASESASSEVLAGAGIIGDSIGVAVSQPMAAAGTTRGATRFITGAAQPRGRGSAADFPAVPAQRTGLSTETDRRREDTLHPAVRAAPARAPSATSRRVDRQRAIRHAEAPASVAEQRVAAVVVEDRGGGGGGGGRGGGGGGHH